MYEYIKGIVTNIESSHICLENNGIGYYNGESIKYFR